MSIWDEPFWYIHQLPCVLGLDISLSLCSASFTKDWWHSQTNLEFICQLKGLDSCLTVRKNVDVSNSVTFLWILHYTSLNGIYFQPVLLWCGTQELSYTPFLGPTYTPQHQGFYWSWNHQYTRPGPLLSGLNPFCYSHLSSNLTMNDLWFAYVRITLCRMGSCSTSWDFLARPTKLKESGKRYIICKDSWHGPVTCGSTGSNVLFLVTGACDTVLVTRPYSPHYNTLLWP